MLIGVVSTDERLIRREDLGHVEIQFWVEFRQTARAFAAEGASDIGIHQNARSQWGQGGVYR